VGILEWAQKFNSLELKETWYEKLQRWQEALEAYERKQLECPGATDATLGRMRCLQALGQWDRLSNLAFHMWAQPGQEASVRREVAHLAAAAEWKLGRWSAMDRYVAELPDSWSEGAFYRAVLAIHSGSFGVAQRHLERLREVLDTELTALVGESYDRAYRIVVKVQVVNELEEIIE
jgi:FKBP12-rapamycin complex-associated protein